MYIYSTCLCICWYIINNLLFNMHIMNIKVIGSDSLSEIYDLELKLFMPTVQNLNMTVFEMCVIVVVVTEFGMIIECLLFQVLDAMEGNLLSQRLLCPWSGRHSQCHVFLMSEGIPSPHSWDALSHLRMTQHCSSVGDQPVLTESLFWNTVTKVTMRYFYRMLVCTPDEDAFQWNCGWVVDTVQRLVVG